MTPQIVGSSTKTMTKDERELVLQEIERLMEKLRAAGWKYTLEVLSDRERRRIVETGIG